MTSSIKLL